MKRNITFLLVLVFLTSCAVQQKTTYRESSARIFEPGLSAIITPLVADMELISQDKIEPYVEEFPYEVNLSTIQYVDNLKRMALLNAAKKYDADVIVSATIEVETTPQGLYRITVIGYPARYVNFRNATAADTWMIDMLQTTRTMSNAAILQGSEKHELRIKK